tara:strand:+ start:160 stop:357 length:198 start_codon:yes stop_codon:yes gene_type:complete
MRLLRIKAPHFVAGVCLSEHGLVRMSAPILSYTIGWGEKKLRDYCDKKGWEISRDFRDLKNKIED